MDSSDSPLVSVILPTYNRAKLLNRAIQSILNQTYSNFEIIVVDDCSIDDTERVVKGFSDIRLKYIRQEHNMGAAIARNKGIEVAQGDYIAFQDSDDEWLPDKLCKQMDAFSCSDAGVVYTSFWLICKKTRSCHLFPSAGQIEGNIHNALLESNFVGTPTAVVKKECLKKVGLFDDLPCLQDWSLWLKMSKCYRFTHITEPLVKAYRQTDSISVSNLHASIFSRKYLLATYFEEISKVPKLLSQHYFDIGTLLCANGKISGGQKYLISALRLNPFNLKIYSSFFTSLFGQLVYNRVAAMYLQTKQ